MLTPTVNGVDAMSNWLSSARRAVHRRVRGRLQFRERGALDALVVLLFLLLVEGRPGALRAAGDGAEGRRGRGHVFGGGGVGHWGARRLSGLLRDVGPARGRRGAAGLRGVARGYQLATSQSRHSNGVRVLTSRRAQKR